MGKRRHDTSREDLPYSEIVSFVRTGNGKSGWCELSDGRTLPVKCVRSRSGIESVRIDHAELRRRKEERDKYLQGLGEKSLKEIETTYTVTDWIDKGGRPEAIDPLVVSRDAVGREQTFSVRVIARETGNLWHTAVRVAVERWRHVIMYREHFERPGYYKVAHREWVNVAEEQLNAIGPDGRGIATKAKQMAIKPHDAWKFKVMLGSEMDRRLLIHLHKQLSSWRAKLQELRGNRLSEAQAVKSLIQSIEEDYHLLAAQGNPLAMFDFERSGLVPGSPHLPAASLPLSQDRRYLLTRVIDDYLFLECDSRDEMTPELIQRALERMPDNERTEIALSGFMPWWCSAPLLPSLGPTKLDLLLRFLESKSTVTRNGDCRRGGWHYLTGISTNGRPCGIPRIDAFLNAFDEWRFEIDSQLLRKHRTRGLKSARDWPRINPRYLFPQMNTFHNPSY